MNVIRWIVGMLIFLAILLLAFDNADMVTLRFFGFTSMQAPLVLVVFVAFAIGVTCGLIAGSLSVVRARREMKKAKKELTKVEKEKAAPPPVQNENVNDVASEGNIIEVEPEPASLPDETPEITSEKQ